MAGFNTIELAKIQQTHLRLSCTLTNRIRENWCPFVVGLGKCDQKCAANPFCRRNLSVVLDDVEEADIPIAAFKWRLKRQKVRVREKIAAAEHEPLERDRLGQVVTGNVFGRIGNQIGGK